MPTKVGVTNRAINIVKVPSKYIKKAQLLQKVKYNHAPILSHSNLPNITLKRHYNAVGRLTFK